MRVEFVFTAMVISVWSSISLLLAHSTEYNTQKVKAKEYVIMDGVNLLTGGSVPKTREYKDENVTPKYMIGVPNATGYDVLAAKMKETYIEDVTGRKTPIVSLTRDKEELDEINALLLDLSDEAEACADE